MVDACPLPTPDQRRRGAIIGEAEATLLDTVFAALKRADETVSASLRTDASDDLPSLRGYFTASLHQTLYCVLCGADSATFAGGDARVAISIIRNAQQIAKSHWGADIEPHPKP